MDFIHDFIEYLKGEGKSKNTVDGYIRNVKEYLTWFNNSFGKDFSILLRQNVLEYKSYLQNIRRNDAKTINHKFSSLKKLNEFLVSLGIQKDVVIDKTDNIKIQQQYASPTNVTELEVKQFLQTILESGNHRNYAIIILLTYTGLRISEALNIKLDDFNLTAGECIIRSGKGDKQRVVMLNSKVVNALRQHLKYRDEYPTAKDSQYLFVSQKNNKLDRTTINRLFNEYSNKITPHQLRHFFCTNALEKGMSIHEAANQAGHSNIHTTLIYTNPNKQKLKDKMELL